MAQGCGCRRRPGNDPRSFCLRKIKVKKRDVKYFHTKKTYGSVKIEQMFGKEARAWRIRNVRHL